MADEGCRRMVRNVCGEGEETSADNSERCSLNLFSSRRVQVVTQTPQQRRSRSDFDKAVQPESDERHGPGNQPSDDGDHSFETVPDDCEIFEPLTTANGSNTKQSGRHTFIMRRAGA